MTIAPTLSTYNTFVGRNDRQHYQHTSHFGPLVMKVCVQVSLKRRFAYFCCTPCCHGMVKEVSLFIGGLVEQGENVSQQRQLQV